MLNLWSMEYHKGIQATKANSNVCQLLSSNIVYEIVFMSRTILKISTSNEGHKHLQTQCFDQNNFHSHKLGMQATFMLHWESWWGGVETSREVIFSGYVLQQRPDTTLLVHQDKQKTISQEPPTGIWPMMAWPQYSFHNN